ncbi:MAG: HDOD domain-containing protein [Candidatus Latescibacterota bacterium]
MLSGALAQSGNPLIIVGDKIRRKPHLIALMQQLRVENALLDEGQQIKYAVCADCTEVALALQRYRDAVKLILLGPGLRGNAVTVARMLSKKAHIVMVIDPAANPLGADPISYQQIRRNLEALGIVLVLAKEATAGFFEPVVNDYVLSGLPPGPDMEKMSPEERAAMLDRRLDAASKFPAMPETQRRVGELDDMAPPKRWAEAIDPDVLTRNVVLRILNSARYGFRSRVETIEQAVALASTRTIREIVTACQVRQLFRKTSEETIDHFWRHSLAAAFYAKLLSMPADAASQTPQQRAEMERFRLDAEQARALAEAGVWRALDLGAGQDTFIAGLLHDVGKVTMLMCLEDSLTLITALIESEVAEHKARNALWARPVLDTERFLMKDMDHQVIGGRLADRWALPEGVQMVISHHHDVHPGSPPLLKLVGLANLAASTLFPYPTTAEQHPFPQLMERIEKAAKKKPGRSLPQAVEEAVNQDVFADLVDVLNRLAPPNHLWEIVDFRTFFRLCYLLAPAVRTAAIAFLQQTA